MGYFCLFFVFLGDGCVVFICVDKFLCVDVFEGGWFCFFIVVWSKNGVLFEVGVCL